MRLVVLEILRLSLEILDLKIRHKIVLWLRVELTTDSVDLDE